MEIGWVENCFFFTTIWVFRQNLKSLVDGTTKCSVFEFASGFGKVGSLIAIHSWWSIHRDEADMRGVCLNIKCELEKMFCFKSEIFLEVFSIWNHKEADMNKFYCIQDNFFRSEEIISELKVIDIWEKNSHVTYIGTFPEWKKFMVLFWKRG